MNDNEELIHWGEEFFGVPRRFLSDRVDLSEWEKQPPRDFPREVLRKLQGLSTWDSFSAAWAGAVLIKSGQVKDVAGELIKLYLDSVRQHCHERNSPECWKILAVLALLYAAHGNTPGWGATALLNIKGDDEEQRKRIRDSWFALYSYAMSFRSQPDLQQEQKALYSGTTVPLE